MPRTAQAPAIATSRVMALTAGTFYVAGGAAAMAVILAAAFPAGPTREVLVGLASAAVVTGAALLRWGARLPRGAFHVVTVLATALITAAVPLCPSTATALAIATVYVLVVIDVVFFFSWRHGAPHLVAVYACAVLALQGREGVSAGVGLALAVVGTVVTVVVGLLVRLASDARRDGLTGLANRRGFDDALEAAHAEARRSGAPLSAALLDLDHFKAVNDEGGHTAGDDLLRAVAADWTDALPAGAVLARRGGDEFAVLLPGHTGREAFEAVEAGRERCTRAPLSAGVAELLVGESSADLLRRADSALGAAKAAGRRQSRLQDDASAELARDLVLALAAGDVRAWFQPIVTPGDGRVVGVEALARWTHPVRGFVSPADFIPVAETTGLITELGAAVLADACRGAVLLSRSWERELLLTVNVSGRELTEPDYPARVLDTLAVTGWPATSLVLEVTESLVDASAKEALDALERLRLCGIGVAIDDFGTGYSTFSRLDTLPADYLKLDAGFIAEITTSERRAGMLRALLSLSATLGLQVIAEGVETPEQAGLLRELACPLAQGWLFGRPVPPEALAATTPAQSAQSAPVGR